MNIRDLLEQVTARGATVALDGDQVKVRGTGERLPDDLMAALREQREAIARFLREPLDPSVAVSEAEAIIRESERLGRKLAGGSIPAVTCGLTGLWCQLCVGMPCRGSSSG